MPRRRTTGPAGDTSPETTGKKETEKPDAAPATDAGAEAAKVQSEQPETPDTGANGSEDDQTPDGDAKAPETGDSDADGSDLVKAEVIAFRYGVRRGPITVTADQGAVVEVTAEELRHGIATGSLAEA